MDLIEFLRARLSEDEAAAKAASVSRPWVVDADDPEALRLYQDGSGVIEAHAEEVAHIARHDPARVLADVAAKRAMLDRCVEALSANQNRMEGYEIHQNDGERYVATDVLAHLAAVYADHPDYRQEWKP